VAAVVVDRHDPRVVDRLVDAERAGTEVTDRRLVADRLIEFVVVAVLVFELGNPLRSRAVIRTLCVLTCSKIAQRFSTVEDQFQFVRVVLGELLGRFETVDESTAIRVRFRSCEDLRLLLLPLHP